MQPGLSFSSFLFVLIRSNNVTIQRGQLDRYNGHHAFIDTAWRGVLCVEI